jgi:hypothetical protein
LQAAPRLSAFGQGIVAIKPAAPVSPGPVQIETRGSD